MLLFDEVKTGITAGWHGAGQRYGVTPDLIAVGKSIGGGLPSGRSEDRKSAWTPSPQAA
jgi:glutamate-1-semialdehyde aminotransferase